MTRRFTLSSLLFILLSSCTIPQVDIGGAIEHRTEHYTALKLDEDGEDEVYRCPNGDYYMKVPEVSYTRSWPVMYWYPSFELNNRQSALQATAKYQWVRLSQQVNAEESLELQFQGYKLSDSNFRVVPLAQEPNLVGCQKAKFPLKGSLLAITNGQAQEEASTARKIAAAPFDYVLDPVLTVSANIVLIPTVIVCAIVVPPLHYLFADEDSEH